MSSHLLVIALVLAPILLTGAVGDSGREGQGNNPGECCGCRPGRNGTSNLLLPLAGEQPPAQSPRALPEPPCRCRRGPVPAPPWRRRLLPPLRGQWHEKPKASSGSCWGVAATPARLERRTVHGTCWKPLARHPTAVTSSAAGGTEVRPLRRHGGARVWEAGKQIAAVNLWGKSHCNFAALMDLFRRSTAAGGNYSLGGRQCSNSFQ